MDRHFIWCASRIYTWSFVLLYILCDLFFFIHDISMAKYVDDITPYFTGLKMSDDLIKLENAVETLLQW